jgi:hypothetical protein
MTDDDDVQRSRRYIIDEDLTREQFESLFPPQFAYAYEPLFASDFRPSGVRQTLLPGGAFAFQDIETGRFVSLERVLGSEDVEAEEAAELEEEPIAPEEEEAEESTDEEAAAAASL